MSLSDFAAGTRRTSQSETLAQSPRVRTRDPFSLSIGKVQNRAHHTYVEPALKVWEAALDPETLLTRISAAQIEAVKLRRAQQVAHATVDKDLAVLKSFFNWCIARQYAIVNPVRRVKFFNEDNARLRYLSTAEYEQLLEAARRVDPSPDLVEKINLAVHTGLRRGSLFALQCDQVDVLNAVVRIPRTKSGRPHAAAERHGTPHPAGASRATRPERGTEVTLRERATRPGFQIFLEANRLVLGWGIPLTPPPTTADDEW